MGLSNKHSEFVNNYFVFGMNGTDAYQATYPKASRETARRNAHVLLTKADIQEEIQARLKERQLGPDEVLARLGDIARGSVADFVSVKTSQDLEKHPRAHIVKKFEKTITRTAYGAEIETVKLELYNARDTLVDLGKANGALSSAGDNENKPFILKVVYDSKGTDSTPEEAAL